MPSGTRCGGTWLPATPPSWSRHRARPAMTSSPSPLIRHDASWRRSRATGWKRCTSSPSPPGCAKGSCSGCDGPTSTSPLARCTSSSSSRRDPHAGRSCSSASRWTRSGATWPGSARSGSCSASDGTTTGWSSRTPWVSPCLHPSNFLQRSFYPLLERAGLPRIRFHDLRHSAATLLLGLGIHPKIVSEMLGYSQIAITLDLYSHVTATMQQEAVRAFDGLFGSQVGSQEGASEH